MTSVARAGSAVHHGEIAQRLRLNLLTDLHVGRLVPRQRLPSTRTVAAELGVDPRRVARAYRDLVIDGLVDLRPRSGYYVADNLAGRRPGLSAFTRWAIEAMVDGGDLGIRPVDLGNQLRACVSAGQLTAACVECNEDQMHGMADELRRDYGMATHAAPLSRLDDPDVRAGLRSADLLVTTAFHSTDVRRLARELGKPYIPITIGPGLRDWMRKSLESTDVYFVVADRAFAQKAKSMFADLDGIRRTWVLVAARDDLSLIPGEAPVYLTRRAREQLGDHPLLSRATSLVGLFSRESRRAILTFVVEANSRRADNAPRVDNGRQSPR